MTMEATGLSAFSQQLTQAVERAGAWTVSVRGRRGSPASGIALESDLVLTADHTVETSRQDVSVLLPDGREAVGQVLGRDPSTDLAVLRVPDAGLTPPSAASAIPRAGALVVLVGKTGQHPAASLGMVSGVGGPSRTRRGGILESYILVDAVMYPGFSGGPLVDTEGQVLGLNTSGLGFGGPSVTIPWASARTVAETLVQHGRVPRGFVGIGSQPITLSAAAQALAGGNAQGLLVVSLAVDGPAARAGFLQGDILVRLDETWIAGPDDLQGRLGPGSVGATVQASVVRGGELRQLPLTIGQRKEDT